MRGHYGYLFLFLPLVGGIISQLEMLSDLIVKETLSINENWEYKRLFFSVGLIFCFCYCFPFLLGKFEHVSLVLFHLTIVSICDVN